MKHAYNLDEAQGNHTHSKEKGYQPAEYEHQEYPKVIHSKKQGQSVTVKDAEEEKAIYDADSEQEAAPEQEAGQ